MKDRDPKAKLGLFLSIPSLQVVETLFHSNFDCLTIDMQHGLIDHAMMLDATRLVPDHRELFVRLPGNDQFVVNRVLDAGISTLICPSLQSVQEVNLFLKYCYYPPLGIRSFGPIRSKSTGKDYVMQQNNEIAPIAMIETEGAYGDVTSIASLNGLKGMFIGPFDLSLSMGLDQLGRVQHPVMKEVLKKVLGLCKKHNLKSMIFTTTVEDYHFLTELGFDYVFFGMDIGLLKKGIDQLQFELK